MAKIPSIALIPSGYKATKIYSVLPVDGSADLTFDRGTSDDQTRVNSNGLIEDVAVDVPRLDYSDGGCPSLLLEPATTNLITYSEDIDNVVWTKSSGGTGSAPVVTANQALSPDGSVNADRVVFDLNGGSGGSDESLIRFNLSVTSGANVTRSIYLRSADGQNHNLIFYDSFDAGSAISIEVTTEWQRFVLPFQVAGTNAGISLGLRNNFGVTTDDTADLYVWGGQIEEKSYATSYVPSLGTSGVRAAETASATGLSSYINSTEGVLYAEFKTISGSNCRISLSDGTNNNTVTFGLNTNGNTQAIVQVGGVAQFDVATSGILNQLDFAKVCLKYKENDFALYVNGLLVGTDVSGATFSSGTLTRLGFDLGNGASDFYGKTKNLRVYNEALSDLELATLTGFSSFAEMRDYLNYTAE